MIERGLGREWKFLHRKLSQFNLEDQFTEKLLNRQVEKRLIPYCACILNRISLDTERGVDPQRESEAKKKS